MRLRQKVPNFKTCQAADWSSAAWLDSMSLWRGFTAVKCCGVVVYSLYPRPPPRQRPVRLIPPRCISTGAGFGPVSRRRGARIRNSCAVKRVRFPAGPLLYRSLRDRSTIVRDHSDNSSRATFSNRSLTQLERDRLSLSAASRKRSIVSAGTRTCMATSDFGFAFFFSAMTPLWCRISAKSSIFSLFD